MKLNKRKNPFSDLPNCDVDAFVMIVIFSLVAICVVCAGG